MTRAELEELANTINDAVVQFSYRSHLQPHFSALYSRQLFTHANRQAKRGGGKRGILEIVEDSSDQKRQGI